MAPRYTLSDIAPMRRLLLSLAFLAAAAPAAAQQTVILVRHAEKAAEGGSDPALSPAGEARATALAAALADARIDAIVSTPFKRTLGTVAPVAAARGLAPETVPIAGGMAAHLQAVVAAVKAKGAGKTVLVVGHSNTIPALVAAFGGPKSRDWCEPEYANLLIMTLPAPGAAGATSGVVRASYGVADPADAGSCASGAMR